MHTLNPKSSGKRFGYLFFCLIGTGLLFSSCGGTPAAAEQQSLDGLDNQLLIDINHLTYSVADQFDHFYSFIGVRALTMVHLAIHDAVNAIDPHFEPYAFEGNAPQANPFAASIAATQTVLIAAYPDYVDTIQGLCAQWMQVIADTSGLQAGIALGKQSAQKIIDLRQGDGHEKQGDYTPMTKPGAYQYTPGFDNWVFYPDFDYARPFTMDSVTQFRSPPPPAMESDAYTDSFLEVKEYGRKNSTVRSEDQTNYAHWWAEFAEHGWNRIGRMLAEKQDLSFAETARMFALINMDIYDIYIASMEAKYYYDTWRPYTAIREGAPGINPAMTAEPDWEPEMLTPPWPEYPSAHAAVAAGGAEVVSRVFGTSDLSFTMESITALPTAKERTYTNLDKAAEDCADSRVMNGYHFRFATDEGLRQGRAIAKNLVENYLQPVVGEGGI